MGGGKIKKLSRDKPAKKIIQYLILPCIMHIGNIDTH